MNDSLNALTMKKVYPLMVITGLLNLIPAYAQTYLNPSAPVDERVADLLPRLTLSEKLSYIGGYDNFYIREIPRMSIPAIKMSDGPVGVRNYGNTTAYPAGVLMAAAWDTALVKSEGHGLGKDARARGVHILLAPGMNIYRIPINGRNFEYFGEDPYLASETAVSYITGLQSEGVMATAKHFAVNSFERNRNNVSAVIDERTLQEIYFPAFRACVEKANVGAFMSAYNKINGIWCSQNNYLLNQTLKGKWNFNGFVMSDWGATHNGIQAALGGLDLEMPAGDNMNSTNLMPYINNGTLTESVIDDKVRRILNELFRFGFFDREQTITSIPLDNPETGQIALNGARGGIVLLKNNAIQPLSIDTVHSIAVVGDYADAYVAGGGSSYTSPNHFISVYHGIDSLVGQDVDVYYSPATLNMDSAYRNSIFYVDSLGSQIGLQASYFNNMTLSGTSVYDTINENINFYWTGAPGIPGIGADNFSVRWSGYILPPTDGNYYFSVASDDGFRLYVNDTLFMENWSDHATQINNCSAYLSTSIKYHIVLEYYENGGIAEIRMGYQSVESATNEAVQLAADADVAVVCVGFGMNNEGEGWDRTFELPDMQSDFIDAVANANNNTIVILYAGGAVQTSPWLDHIRGFIHAFYPGQYGGYALAEILFGNVNPSGKLPFSFDREWSNNPAYNDYNAAGAYDAMNYSEGIFVGYRYYDTATTVTPLYPFGYGLSYTTFNYINLVLVPDDESNFTHATVQFDITNTGDRAGNEIAQLYVHDIAPVDIRPFKELKAFDKVWLDPAETKTVTFTLDLNAFKYFKESLGEWDFDPGEFEIMIGASSQDIRLRDTLSLTADMVMPEAIRLYPPDNETFVETDPHYSITFSREMNCAGPSFYIRRYSDERVIDTITNSDFGGCGTRNITFLSHVTLDNLTEYYIDMPSGYFKDNLGKDFKGFLSKDDWNFKTNAASPSGIEAEAASTLISLCPNPSDDELFIRLDPFIGAACLEFRDLNGKIIFSDRTGKNTAAYRLDLSGIPPGTYVLYIVNNTMNITKKVVVL
jgi:beta-glucosidase